MTQNKKAKILGLTGGSGSGKGCCARFLENMGVYVIYTDDMAHALMSKGNECYSEVISFFGNYILDEYGNINRRELGNIVFNDKQKLDILSSIVHKYIREDVLSIIDNISKSYNFIAIDAPVLIEAGMAYICDYIIGVFADEQTKIKRIIKRDSLSKNEAQSRISSQMPEHELKKNIDYIIENNGTLKELEKCVYDIMHNLENKQ